MIDDVCTPTGLVGTTSPSAVVIRCCGCQSAQTDGTGEEEPRFFYFQSNNKLIKDNISMQTDSIDIARVTSTKFLDVMIDHTLTWYDPSCCPSKRRRITLMPYRSTTTITGRWSSFFGDVFRFVSQRRTQSLITQGLLIKLRQDYLQRCNAFTSTHNCVKIY